MDADVDVDVDGHGHGDNDVADERQKTQLMSIKGSRSPIRHAYTPR